MWRKKGGKKCSDFINFLLLRRSRGLKGLKTAEREMKRRREGRGRGDVDGRVKLERFQPSSKPGRSQAAIYQTSDNRTFLVEK